MSNFLNFHNNLYLGKSIENKNLTKLKKKLEKHPLLSGLFVITISTNPNDQLDIYDSKQFIQKFHQNQSYMVVGLAGNYDEALELIERITNDCMRNRNDCLIKEYFVCG